VELSETSVIAKNGAMVAYQGDVRFEHKGGGLGRFVKKAIGESLSLMQAEGSGELFLAYQAMLVDSLESRTSRSPSTVRTSWPSRPASIGT
jgi:uncharacterized protein (AIM24 family)